jgi:gluconate:H+ symporter, GntP family
MSPILILIVGLVLVVGMIVVLRSNAFIALVTGAIAVSLLAPGEWAWKIDRVARAFGDTTASIGIVIALAAVIGKAMMDSGAADRIVQMFLDLFGEKRSSSAMMASGFTLSIPVFFDTAFYLLVPLARSLYRRTGRHYLKYLLAITAGAVVTHTLVPPTPGPLFIANRLGIDLGVAMLAGIVVGLPTALVGMLVARWIDARMPIEIQLDDDPGAAPLPDARLPGLAIALAPIVLPIVLITINSIVKMVAQASIADAPLRDPELSEAILAASRQGLASAQWFQWTNLFGNPNLALLASAAIAVGTYYRQRRPTLEQMAAAIEQSLASGGVIILITAAGGAFGAMLKTAQLDDAIRQGVGDATLSGIPMILLAFAIASLIKFAQGSSTAAMIVASGMIGAMLTPDSLGCHPVYLGLAIGSGSLVGSWMNDSGFWIFSKMGGLSETEALRSWTPLLAILGCTAMVITVILALLLPMAG